MFIAIPLGTDAPIYHWPKATVALIVLNIAAFLFVPPVRSVDLEPDDEEAEVESVAETPFERFALTLGGHHLRPLQWVTHNFLHFGFLHLAGNMVFLWAFGIVAEGKLGMLKYLATYLAIGTAHGALTQLLFFRQSEVFPAAGASAVIFGLLSLCLVWAPRNEVNCQVILWVGFRIFTYNWDLRYTTVALFYVGEQALNIAWAGMLGVPVVSEIGHLSGAFWGLVIGTIMVRSGWVDCEGWDLYSLLVKNRKLRRDWKQRGAQLDRQRRAERRPVKASPAAQAPAADEPSPEDRAAAAVRKVRKLLDLGDVAGALAHYDKSARTLPAWPPEADLRGFVKALHAQQAWEESVPLMRDYLRAHPQTATRMRLLLAQVLIRELQQPSRALRVLADLPPQPLDESLEPLRRQLTRQAKQMQQDGVLELGGDDH